MKMKKLLSLTLAGIMAFSLAACSGGGSSSSSGGSDDSSGGESGGGQEYDVVYLTPSTASQFWTYVGIGIENAMLDIEESEGITVNYEIVGPAEESQTEEYVSTFEEVIAKQPDAIVTATLAIDATVPKAQEATNAGIVLNFVNCGIGTGDDGANEEYYNQFYYCSNDTIGEMAAQAFVDAMEAKNMDPADGGVVGVNMNVENEALNHRIDAFRDKMAELAPDLTLTDTYYNQNVVENSQSNAENIISTYGDELVGMYSGNNITGDGVCNAVASAGIGSDIVSVAVDSDDNEIQALENGNLDAIIVQDAYAQGYQCMENALLTLINGENPETEKQINCPPVVITADSLEDEEMLDLLDPTRLQRD